MSQTTDTTAPDVAFKTIADALNGVEEFEAECLLSYMLAVVARARRPGLPAASVKAELAELIGKAVDAQAAKAEGYDAAKVAG